MERKRSRSRMTAVAVTIAGAVVLALGAAPMVGFGADHLDAPGLTPPSGRLDGDINDVYVFEGANAAKTALAVTTHPAAGAISPLAYATDVSYRIHVDNDGDAKPELTFKVRFGAWDGDSQPYRIAGRDARGMLISGNGDTGDDTTLTGGGRAFAGLRSDPFFFDLAAFRGSVLGIGDRRFCDATPTDFFEELNTNAIVIQLPDAALGEQIGVYATTRDDSGKIDRMARPAINTVFNSGSDKNAFNAASPWQDPMLFTDNVTGVLQAFSGLDEEGAYSDGVAALLASILLPDVVTYDTSTDAQGPLNGRALSDDVIDAELNIVTGGFEVEGRDDTGAIPSDCVSAHTDYQSVFPYLGEPHS
jgi:hypothetical protein